MMMPDMDGLEVLKWIRTTPSVRHLRVALMTAKSDDAEVLRQGQYRADLYLVKPFHPLDALR